MTNYHNSKQYYHIISDSPHPSQTFFFYLSIIFFQKVCRCLQAKSAEDVVLKILCADDIVDHCEGETSQDQDDIMVRWWNLVTKGENLASSANETGVCSLEPKLSKTASEKIVSRFAHSNHTQYLGDSTVFVCM
jgi:hypothetical protein